MVSTQKSAKMTTDLAQTAILVVSLLILAGGRADCTCETKGGPLAETSALLSFLEEVQGSALATFGSANFDPKQYVDLPLRFNVSVSRQAFQDLPRLRNGSLAADVLTGFIGKYFDDAGSDMEFFSPPDFVPEPEGFLPRVKNPEVRKWALEVHSLWKVLSRKVNKSVGELLDYHTLLPLPDGVIIPGSRFREVYYWDSYWIIRGLLASKMYETAKGVVNNLISLISKYGFVLNGARSYYTNRSQPPLLSAMVEAIYMKTGDKAFLKKTLPALLQEHKFWNSGFHKVSVYDMHGVKHSLSRYYAMWNAPRPESSTIDKVTADGLPETKRKLLYREIATTAETGWDFSSRWMRDRMNLTTLHTTSIIPVDLNIYLLQMELNIAFFAKKLGNSSIAKTFTQASVSRYHAIDAILWNDDMGQWLDYWIDPHKCETIQINGQQSEDVYMWDTKNQNKNIFASNFFPLWIKVFHSDATRVEKVIHKFQSSGLLQPAGISTSLLNTTQQWDFPNGWAPSQHIIIEGIAQHKSNEGKMLAKDIARRWLRTNYATFKSTGQMHEKYDVEACGKIGNGGEYTTQTGFGWSNGVVLALLEKFGWHANTSIDCS
uniref:Trehalase n=1 Tax=Araucaria cunninghamii TaxID=56994 RepID=A0A0D6QZS9_ARACU